MSNDLQAIAHGLAELVTGPDWASNVTRRTDRSVVVRLGYRGTLPRPTVEFAYITCRPEAVFLTEFNRHHPRAEAIRYDYADPVLLERVSGWVRRLNSPEGRP